MVTVAFLYIKPRNLFRKVKKKGIKRFFFEDFLESQDSPQKKALSVALGVFIGVSPLWGFHTVLVLFLAVVLKLNKVIAFAFSNVSLPPFIPFIVFMSLKVGSFVLGEPQPSFTNIGENFEMIKSLKTYIVGSFTLAIISAITIGILGYVFLIIFYKKNNAS